MLPTVFKGAMCLVGNAKPALTPLVSGLTHRTPLTMKAVPVAQVKKAPTVEEWLRQAPAAPTHKLPTTADEWIKRAPSAPTHRASEDSMIQARLNKLNPNVWNPNLSLEQKVKRIQEMKAQIKQHEIQHAKAMQTRLNRLNPNAWNPNWSNQEKIQAIHARAIAQRMPNAPTTRISAQQLAQYRAGTAPCVTAQPKPSGSLVHQSASRTRFEQGQAVLQTQRQTLASKQAVLNRLNVLQEQVMNNSAHTPQKRLALLQRIQTLRVENFQRQ